MKTTIHETASGRIAEITDNEKLVTTAQDGLDLMADLYYQDVEKIILHEKDLAPAFFDLKTGLAGEILQKFSNYRVRLAIVGDFSKYPGKNIADFIYESNKHTQVNFVRTVAEAIARLSVS